MIEILITILILFIIILIIASHIRIVPEYQRLVVFRLGRLIGVRGPGLVILLPFIDKGITVDLREFVLDIPPQTCITKDNAPVDVDLLIYLKIFDPSLAVTAVQNYVLASSGIAVTTLRAIIGDMLLDDVLAKREYINSTLRAKLDEVTDRWGIKVQSVEIKEIKPPREVQEAMIKQMAAERNKRAMILEAEGKKTSAILEAEGYRESMVKKGEGERQYEILVAEGKARALELINEAAMKLGSNALLLQYMDTLKSMAQSPATKIVLPMELLSIMTSLLKTTESKTNTK
ncbi:MAG: SPFH domain-containing protein [Desulfurococcaceae archaeon]|uniref:SPFH/Band 7/PHB domain protein n=1 Tax=Staphylothermus marinus TaxID=2280 RepID=A0A7C4D824_STAMA